MFLLAECYLGGYAQQTCIVIDKGLAAYAVQGCFA